MLTDKHPKNLAPPFPIVYWPLEWTHLPVHCLVNINWKKANLVIFVDFQISFAWRKAIEKVSNQASTTPGYKLWLETSFLKVHSMKEILGLGQEGNWSPGLLTKTINVCSLFLLCQQPLTFPFDWSTISHGKIQGKWLPFPKVQRPKMSQKLNYLQLPAFLFLKSHVRVDTEHVHLYLVLVCMLSKIPC